MQTEKSIDYFSSFNLNVKIFFYNMLIYELLLIYGENNISILKNIIKITMIIFFILNYNIKLNS